VIIAHNNDDVDRYDHFKKQMDFIQKFYYIKYSMEEILILMDLILKQKKEK
jgi:hypothetical protein